MGTVSPCLTKDRGPHPAPSTERPAIKRNTERRKSGVCSYIAHQTPGPAISTLLWGHKRVFTPMLGLLTSKRYNFQRLKETQSRRYIRVRLSVKLMKLI